MQRVFDISEWQPSGTVQTIKELGAEGVILRLGLTFDGTPTLDEKFIEFVNQAVAEGIPYGIYYYSKMDSYDVARMEAQWINDKVYELLNGQEPELGVWLDIEDNVNKIDGIHELVHWTIDTMKGWGFKNVGIYSGYSFINSYFNIPDLAAHQTPLWVANYDSTHWLREEHPELNHVAWQFTDSYEGNNLDCNEWYGF